LFVGVGTNEIISWYALTGHRGESGILISGTTKFSSPNCIVFYHDMLIRRIFFSLLISMLLLHNWIKSIGKDPDEYSSHRFRRGGASWAFSAEVPSELIQLYGDCVAPGNACVVHPLIPSTYFGIDAEIIVALFSW
jgi:hypothetical protein